MIASGKGPYEDISIRRHVARVKTSRRRMNLPPLGAWPFPDLEARLFFSELSGLLPLGLIAPVGEWRRAIKLNPAVGAAISGPSI